MQDLNRRAFLRTAGTAAASVASASAAPIRVSIIVDAQDPALRAEPVRWAAGELQKAVSDHGIAAEIVQSLGKANPSYLAIVASVRNPAAGTLPDVPGSLAIANAKTGGRPAVLATGSDTEGTTLALLELADRVRNSADAPAVLSAVRPISERPATKIRSVTRLFTSDVEDKPWFYDREMWPQYLDMLAAQRFNRFNLSVGIGYDFLRQVTDAYFLFPYPFLLDVPGYKVRVPQLPNAERDRNLETLKYISEQTVARGMQFQLGLWMHGYEWINSARPNYTIEGLNRTTHGPYCRDAVRMLLKACAAISGVTFRIHGESGVEEGSYDFWKAVFEGVATCGRRVGIDMHAKGMDQQMINVALASGVPITISPKYWAEHMGMPYHQADIRELERPGTDRQTSALMKFSAGSRSFLRYGYGDLLREDRRWGVLFRIWPGTQRLLMWADPVTAAAHAKAFSFCGSDGVEIMEPLSFKGRRGSGIAGDRCAYADKTLRPRWDWQKYVYGYRVWGRSLYNPETEPDVFARYLNKEFGSAGRPLGDALANASRILPIITTAHGASAANNTYWPEIYTNQSIVDAEHSDPYRDTPAPRVFGNVSPFDPQLFSRMNEYADELLSGERTGKYSPIEAAQWIEDYAESAVKNLTQAESQTGSKSAPAFRRVSIYVALQAGIGKFFGAKFRSGVLYRIYEKTRDRTALEESIRMYRLARNSWAELANRAKDVYVSDITVGEHRQLRGHWMDRLPAIDADIRLLEAKLADAKRSQSGSDADSDSDKVQRAIRAAVGRPQRVSFGARHTPPTRFRPGEPLPIELSVAKKVASVRLFYRQVNHAERYESQMMKSGDTRYSAVIPGTYTESPYPLEYYFELKDASGAASLHPGFTPSLTNQPYFVVRRG